MHATDGIDSPRWFPVPGRPWESALKLPSGGATVWKCRVPVGSVSLARFEAVLDSEERGQARRFVSSADRELYTAAHGLVRLLLGAYTGGRPEALRFVAGEWGKPALAGAGGAGELAFNLAHSGATVLVVVAAAPAVGVDVERHRRLRDALEVAERFFSPRESELLRGCTPPARHEAFFRLWTRKEAVVKAAGRSVAGLSREVEVLPVSEGADAGEADIPVPAGGGSGLRVRWTDLPAEAGYSAAFAACGPPLAPRLNDLGSLD